MDERRANETEPQRAAAAARDALGEDAAAAADTQDRTAAVLLSEMEAPHPVTGADADVLVVVVVVVAAGRGEELEEERADAPLPPPAAPVVAVPLDPPPPPPPPPGGTAGEGAVAEDNGPDHPIVIPTAPEGQEAEDEDAHPVQLEVYGFREAVRLLTDANDRRRIDDLFVVDDMRGGGGPLGVSIAEIEREEALAFSQLVTLLGRREGGRIVQNFALSPSWRGLSVGDMERLFRDVLPLYPTIDINIEGLPTRILRMLTDKIPTEEGAWPLTEMVLTPEEPEDDVSDNVRAIVDMLQRPVAIPELHLSFDLDADQCKLICQALPSNTNLRKLRLNVEKVFADTLDGVAESSLQDLTVNCAQYSADAVASLARQLRTNTTLESLRFGRFTDNAHRDNPALLDLVRTYNYTLRSLREFSGWRGDENRRMEEQFQVCMRRNAGVRNVLKNLKDPSLPAVPTELLPHVLERVSDIPTALYRIVKMDRARIATDGDRRGRGRRRRRHP